MLKKGTEQNFEWRVHICINTKKFGKNDIITTTATSATACNNNSTTTEAKTATTKQHVVVHVGKFGHTSCNFKQLVLKKTCKGV